MADHGARDHATWSASATARNVHCAGALALARFAPPDKESIHAARGTAGHQVGEKCLRTGADASAFLGEVEKTKEHEITIDEEIVNSVQEYVDYVRSGMKYAAKGKVWDAFVNIEQRFSLGDLNPPFDAGGTGDAVIVREYRGEIEVVDFKNGMGVVDVNGNPQLRTYGLGALLSNPRLDVETVKVTIVQPRAPHKDGRIRSETFHVADLVAWTADLLKAMKRSKAAMDEYDAAGGNSVNLDEWAEKWLNPGKCTFCPVEATCPALRKGALDVAAVWFDDLDQPRIGNTVNDMSPEKLAQTLDMIPMLEDWIKAVRAYAHAQAEAGVDIPGYQLSEKIGNRKFFFDDDIIVRAFVKRDRNALRPVAVRLGYKGKDIDKAVEEMRRKIEAANLSESDIYADPKLKSPAQMDKLLGAKRKALIEPFVERPVTGTNLVSAEKSSRPPAKTTAQKYFETTK